MVLKGATHMGIGAAVGTVQGVKVIFATLNIMTLKSVKKKVPKRAHTLEVLAIWGLNWFIITKDLNPRTARHQTGIR